MIVVVSSVRGSPGVTSWSLLLAAAWPTEYGVERVVLEADPAGGVLGVRYDLGVDPGAVTLIAGLRRSAGEPVPVSEHGRPIGSGVWVIPGPETGEQSLALWSRLAASVAEGVADDERVWLVDAGRIDAASPQRAFVEHATLTLVMSRAAHEDLLQVPARVATMQRTCPTVGVIVVGKPRHGAPELGEFFGTGLVWTVPEAKDDMTELVGAAVTGGRARRSWLWRRAVEVAADVATKTTHEPAPARTRLVVAP